MAVIRYRFKRKKRKRQSVVENETSHSVHWYWALMNRSYPVLADWYHRDLCGGYVYENVLEFFPVEDTPYDAPALLIKIRVPKNAQEWEYTQLNLREMGILLMRDINDPEGSEYGEG